MFTLTLAKRIQSFANFWKILECDSDEFILFTHFFHRDYPNEHGKVDAIISGGRFSTVQLQYYGKKSSCNN